MPSRCGLDGSLQGFMEFRLDGLDNGMSAGQSAAVPGAPGATEVQLPGV